MPGGPPRKARLQPWSSPAELAGRQGLSQWTRPWGNPGPASQWPGQGGWGFLAGTVTSHCLPASPWRWQPGRGQAEGKGGREGGRNSLVPKPLRLPPPCLWPKAFQGREVAWPHVGKQLSSCSCPSLRGFSRQEPFGGGLPLPASGHTSPPPELWRAGREGSQLAWQLHKGGQNVGGLPPAPPSKEFASRPTAGSPNPIPARKSRTPFRKQTNKHLFKYHKRPCRGAQGVSLFSRKSTYRRGPTPPTPPKTDTHRKVN